MTTYDVVMIGLVVAGMIWGTIRGFAWQMASIASLVLGYFCATHASAYMLPFLALYLPGDPAVQRGGAMLLAYLLISGAAYFAAWSLRATLKRMKFEVFDRHLGMLLGGVEGALLGVVGTMFVVSMSPSAREPIFTSRAGHVVARVMDVAGPALPAEVRDAITPFWGRVRATASPQPSLADQTGPGTPVDPTADGPPSPNVSRRDRPGIGPAGGDESRADVERVGEVEGGRKTRLR